MDRHRVIQILSDNGFDLAGDGIGLNIKAQTHYEQYIIYLKESHVWDNKQTIISKIETLLGVTVDGISQVPFRRSNEYVVEVWVFINDNRTQDHDKKET